MKVLVIIVLQLTVLVLIVYSIGHRFGVLDGLTAAGAAWILMPWAPTHDDA
jgi:hypothetical protein